MLNYIWTGMILIGVVFGAASGRLSQVTNAAVSSSKDAVALCVTMLGVMSLWTGLMKIAEKSGLIQKMSDGLRPVLHFLFPNIPQDHLAMKYISTNFIANFLGLGWAATPAGLKAMEALQTLNPDKEMASVEMCTFLIINMSSIQLITVNVIAYRAQYNSANPSEIIGPGLIATAISAAAGIAAAKLLGGRRLNRERRRRA